MRTRSRLDSVPLFLLHQLYRGVCTLRPHFLIKGIAGIVTALLANQGLILNSIGTEQELLINAIRGTVL